MKSKYVHQIRPSGKSYYADSFLQTVYRITGISFIDSEEVLSLQIAEFQVEHGDLTMKKIAWYFSMPETSIRRHMLKHHVRIESLIELMRHGKWNEQKDEYAKLEIELSEKAKARYHRGKIGT